MRGITDQLFRMMEVPGGSSGGSTNAAPPFITFTWGSETTFKSVCTSLTVAYKLFRLNGDPIRADVKMTLKQAEAASTASSTGANKGTNLTTRANAGHGVHRVKDGDSLPSIAYEAYGDATVWRAIADANGIENPLHLPRARAEPAETGGLMPDSADHVAGITIIVDGAAIQQEYRDLLTEVRVRDTLALPDAAMIRITDPKGENIDAMMKLFGIGKEVEIKVSAIGDRATKQIFKGEIVDEPDFGQAGVNLAIRALDKGHRLQRQRKVRTFQQMSASDIVNKLARENGLRAQVDSTNVVFEFFQQSAETDWA